MKYDDQSPELKAAFAALDAHEQSPDLGVASLHVDRATAYALVSIAQSLEKLAGCVSDDGHHFLIIEDGRR